MAHTHPNLTITSGLTNHNHTAHFSGLKNCLYAGATDHNHFVIVDFKDSHGHDLTVSIDSAGLGSPWWNHTHTVTLVSETNGGGSHQHAENDTGGECDACAGFAHTHPTGNTGAGGAAHNAHTVTATTSTADPAGTPEAHTHTVAFNTGLSGSHLHTAVALALALCNKARNHSHTLSGWVANSHLHSASGTTGLGGEPAPTVGKNPFGDGFVFAD